MNVGGNATSTVGAAGAVNTGGGGGGGAHSTHGGGDGGSGIVVVRYPVKYLTPHEQGVEPSSPPVWVMDQANSPALGQPYEVLLAARSLPYPSFSVTAGQLPDGLTLDPRTGKISGTATTLGPFSYTVTASSAAGSVSLTVTGTVLEQSAISATGGVVYERTFDGVRYWIHRFSGAGTFTVAAPTTPVPFEPVVASGGTVNDVVVDGATYRTHTFSTPGTTQLQVTDPGMTGEIEYLVVGGGGSGGGAYGGGGGGGGALQGRRTAQQDSYTVTVGQGGAATGVYTGSGGTPDEGGGTSGTNGSNSTFDDLVAVGGGAGGAARRTGAQGGSGGGGNGGWGKPGGLAVLSGAQGSNGGNGNGNGNNGGNGGAGVTSNISGVPVTYAGGGGGSGFGGYGGGGGGGAGQTGGTANTAGQSGTASSGGGGAGQSAAGSGVNGLGGGGGGGVNQQGAGGSGVVIVRYPLTATATPWTILSVAQEEYLRVEMSAPFSEQDGTDGWKVSVDGGPFTAVPLDYGGPDNATLFIMGDLPPATSSVQLLTPRGQMTDLFTLGEEAGDGSGPPEPPSPTIEVLVVGGGGGGGGYAYAGGGGAGGLVHAPSFSVRLGDSIPVTVGAGGSGGHNREQGRDGGQSTFGPLVALGGGGGGSWGDAPSASAQCHQTGGRAGGSGGGGSVYHKRRGCSADVARGQALQATQTRQGLGYGNGGGAGSSASLWAGGGGGGAGQPGADGVPGRAGDGGEGMFFGDRFGFDEGDAGWFAAGGGGGWQSGATGSTGGRGGGGGGAQWSSLAQPGVDGTGGGGGGGTVSTTALQGNRGGSGVVYVRYPVSLRGGVITMDPQVLRSELADGYVGYPFTDAPVVSSSPSPQFALTSGQLPSGLTLDAASGRFVGTPSQAGVFPVTLEVSNSLTQVTQSLSVRVLHPKDGSTAERAAESAQAIKQVRPDAPDGVYWIDLPTVGPTQVFCLMDERLDGGGWMMMLKAARGTTFSFYSPHWTTATTLNLSATDRNNGDAKFEVMNRFAGKDMMALWPERGQGGSLSVPGYPLVWLQNNFFLGNRIVPISLWSSVDRYFISDAVNFPGVTGFSRQTDVRFYGFNYRALGTDTRTRWGFGWNENGGGLFPSGNETSPDVAGGIGLIYRGGVNYSAGDHIGCCQNVSGFNTSNRVELYLR